MLKTLSRPAFEALASVYDQGEDTWVPSSSLGLEELLGSGMLSPAGPLKTIEVQAPDGSTELYDIVKSPFGFKGYLCPDRGWVKVGEQRRKQYRFHKEQFEGFIKSVLALSGQMQTVTGGLAFLGLYRLGEQTIEIYLSEYLDKKQCEKVQAFMDARLVQVPAVVLHKSTQPSLYGLGKKVSSLGLNALWGYEDRIGNWWFQRALSRLVFTNVVDTEGFLWFPESGTFIKPDKVRTFAGASGKQIVDYLVQNHEQGGDSWMDQRQLLQDFVGVKSTRVKDVVKSVEGWKDVILVKGAKCRLNV